MVAALVVDESIAVIGPAAARLHMVYRLVRVAESIKPQAWILVRVLSHCRRLSHGSAVPAPLRRSQLLQQQWAAPKTFSCSPRMTKVCLNTTMLLRD